MNLSVLERLTLLMILPKEGNFATLKILSNLRMSLSFTEEEVKKWNVVSDPVSGSTTWNEKSGETEIPIGEKATDIIVDAFEKLDREEKLTEEMMGAYERFIPTTE